jgi:hypothetical protein
MLWNRIMPRKARIDAAGALHHIICRGIERRKIFMDDIDRNNFIDRLGGILAETKTPCFAWALMPINKDWGKDIKSLTWYQEFNCHHINDHHLSSDEKRKAKE